MVERRMVSLGGVVLYKGDWVLCGRTGREGGRVREMEEGTPSLPHSST